MRSRFPQGFSLVELLLALAIIGIIAAVAIPTLSGQRTRAKRIGDAEANARVLAMALEGRKAENGIYGPADATATWTPASNTPTLSAGFTNPAPAFTPQGNSRMTYQLTVQPLTYALMVYEGSTAADNRVVGFDQTGAKTIYAKGK